jgi:hypothetical protein
MDAFKSKNNRRGMVESGPPLQTKEYSWLYYDKAPALWRFTVHKTDWCTFAQLAAIGGQLWRVPRRIQGNPCVLTGWMLRKLAACAAARTMAPQAAALDGHVVGGGAVQRYRHHRVPNHRKAARIIRLYLHQRVGTIHRNNLTRRHSRVPAECERSRQHEQTV